MGAAFEFYNELGCGMAEENYQAALEVELGSSAFQLHANRQETGWLLNQLLEKRRADLSLRICM